MAVTDRTVAVAAAAAASPVDEDYYYHLEEEEEKEAASASEEEETEEYQKNLEFIFEVVLLSVVGALGILGNAVLLYLFSLQRRVQVSLCGGHS